MIVSNTNREKNTVTFDVTLDAAEFEKFVNEAYKKNRSKITVTGFRKGHAPRMIIEGMYGKDVFYDDAMNEAAPEAFAFAVENEKLEVVGRPAVEKCDVTEEKGLLISFRTDVWPEVTLGQYKGLEAEKASAEVTEADIDEEVQKLRAKNSRIVAVEREAALGDTVNINYLGTVDGVPFEGGAAEGHNLKLGSGMFIPGFEDQLVGIKAGEERDVNVTFPEDYVENLAGKAAVFAVKCNEVKEEQLPEVDDEFAKDNDFDTVADMRADLGKKLTEAREAASRNAFEDAVVDKAVENMTVEIPEGMIEDRMDDIVRQYAQYIQAQGIPFDQYVQMMGGDIKSFRETTRDTASKQVRTEVLLRAVAEAEAIEVSEEEQEKELASMAEQYNMKVEDVRKAVDTAVMVAELKQRKAIDMLVGSAVAVAPKAPAAETEE